MSNNEIYAGSLAKPAQRRGGSGIASFLSRPKLWVCVSVSCLAVVFIARWFLERSTANFVPSEATARVALDCALRDWQSGQASDTFSDESMTVHSADSVRQSKRALQAYEILGPVAGDSPRCFAVRLELDGPRENVSTRYVVFGRNPYWVVRHDDLEMIAHWDHHMEPTDKK
jgi:hypothetical protein